VLIFHPFLPSLALAILMTVGPLSRNALASTETFHFKTLDGKTELKGQLDLPEKQGKLPLVIMMPGTGLFDRDVNFGHSQTEKDLLFKRLSNLLNQKGVATLRYDYRGVSCNYENTPPCESCKTPQEKIAHFMQSCFNNEIRTGVTPQNMRSDFEQIYHWGEKHERVDPQQMVVFAHSEGSVHTAHLIAEQRIQPRAVILMGGLYESPQSVVKWQLVNRFHDNMMKADSNQDQKVTAEEITAYQPLNAVLAMLPLEMLLPPEDIKVWTSQQLLQLLSAQHQEITEATLAEDDALPYPSAANVQASMEWWKMFFSDTQNTAPLFAQGKIPVINHLGDADSQVSLDRQQAILDQVKKPHLLSIQKHPGEGHALGAHTLLGPMSPDSETQVVESILKQLNP
jgi:hypothetical protein